MEKIIKILQEINPSIDYEKEEDLIASGLFSSFDVLQCISAFEEAFNIEIAPKYLNNDNFKSAKTMLKMIQTIQKS